MIQNKASYRKLSREIFEKNNWITHARRGLPPPTMHIKINKSKLRFRPQSSEDEIFQFVQSRNRWNIGADSVSRYPVFFVWDREKQVEIRNDIELRLAARIISEDMFALDEFAVLEEKAKRHMEASDSEPEEAVCSDDDITMEDFYMMGFRHEIYN